MRHSSVTNRSAAGALALALAFAGASLAWAAPPDPSQPAATAPRPGILTLEQALTLAFQGNRDVRNAALEVAKAEDELRSFRTQALPQFNVYALSTQTLDDIKVRVPAGAFGDFPATGPIPATDTEVTTPAGRQTLFLGEVAQPLTQLRKVSLGTRLKRANFEISREQLRARRQDVANDVRRVYYGLLRSQSGLAAAEDSLAALRELDRVVEARVEQKVELLAGGLEVKARLARAEYDALSLRNSLLSGREQLNDLVGRPIDVPFSVDTVPEIAPYEADLEATRAIALANRADLKEARLRQRQAEIDRRLKRWDFVPEVSLTYSYLALPSVELLPKSFTTVGLMLSWEPFDWGRRRHALAEARKSAEQSDNLVQQAESQAAIDVGVKFRSLQEARSLLEAARLAQEAAREVLKVTTERYRQKTVLLKDVLEGQEKLASADRQRDEALLSAWTARADLERALGED